jgi:YgiT-type zinc finger domain-containing protein
MSFDVKPVIDCHRCGTIMEFHIMPDTVKIRGQLVTVEKMPVDICPNCGERYYNGPFIVELERAMAEQVAA